MNTLYQFLKPFCILLLLLTQSSFSASKPNKKPDPPTIYAFIVGIENYRSGFRPLDDASDDAYYLQQYLTSVDGMALPNANVKIITDTKATKDNILLELQRLSDVAKENDLFIFYFSGHGTPGHFVPFGNDGTNEYSFVAHRDIRNILARCRAKNKLILSDACFSGEAAKASSDYIQRQYYKEMLATKGSLSMMASSKGDEMSLEAEGHQHGYFTYHLVEGMKGKADENKNGIITLLELFDYVRYNVVKGTNYRQNPTISDGYDETMPVVFSLENAEKTDIEVAWKDAKQKNTETAYNQFIRNYPNSVLVDDAREKIDNLKKANVINSVPPTTQVKSADFTENHDGLGLKMVFVEGGSFKMGGYDYKPIHQVIVSDFYIGKYEVTQREWRSVMGSDPPELAFNNCDDCPVESVSWNDVQEFISKLNSKTGKKYRLQTEAEWEYAARGGSKSKNYRYAGTSDDRSLYQYANFCDKNCEFTWKEEKQNDNYAETSPVGTFQPNELGIYDMSGNVFEWCNDWFDSNYYSKAKDSIIENPTGAVLGSYRVYRGGAWAYNSEFCRVATRNCHTPSIRGYDLGFRVCLSVR